MWDIPEVGQMALASTPKWVDGGEWPLVCRILDVDRSRDVVMVQWYIRDGKNKNVWVQGQQLKDNKCIIMLPEPINLEDIYYHSFELTPKGCLPQKALREEQDFCEEYVKKVKK